MGYLKNPVDLISNYWVCHGVCPEIGNAQGWNLRPSSVQLKTRNGESHDWSLFGTFSGEPREPQVLFLNELEELLELTKPPEFVQMQELFDNDDNF